MYDSGLTKASQPVHYDIAQKMAQEIIERFTPSEQNDCIEYITNAVKERREIMIKEMEENLYTLKNSYRRLNGEAPQPPIAPESPSYW